MLNCFITIRFLDLIDIFLVAFLLYQLYWLIRGTVAIRIFIAIFSIYVFWLLVKAMKMELLSSILGQVIGVGVIALIIVFQQEIRKFLLLLGNRYFNRDKSKLSKIFQLNGSTNKDVINIVVNACFDMGQEKTGALIVFEKSADLKIFAETGTVLDALVSERVIKSIFFKNSPLHDGAMIISNGKIHSAGCVLPLSDNPIIPKKYGLRHRAAVGISEITDSIVIVVSEENGNISYVNNGILQTVKTKNKLTKLLENNLL
ncbi:MAG TPA: diadenylate cyclase CdaA [Bacteroidales bacterium]|mgnify:CR=1 FL=1|nr:diadenylate cyclase CdaA [Bacteroidales bacterium]MDD4234407.1 diadenylate cyclase CdaA [Bacteroidales bacterium]MDY0159797.1 diadenylate cyclase CdaA [Bacteroidales bacterium]HRW20492.1 diadenylate cyclase CdaA [Bacteroidales bacterium]HXK80723.1 diadenylate cyclase CdaA [Bacteroidales bacterium]